MIICFSLCFQNYNLLDYKAPVSENLKLRGMLLPAREEQQLDCYQHHMILINISPPQMNLHTIDIWGQTQQKLLAIPELQHGSNCPSIWHLLVHLQYEQLVESLGWKLCKDEFKSEPILILRLFGTHPQSTPWLSTVNHLGSPYTAPQQISTA